MKRHALIGLGAATVLASEASPLERRFATHMLQHLLLGDLGPLLLALGLAGALPLVLRPLAHPLVALPAWAGALLLWHLSAAYDAALHHVSLHALQHASFLCTGFLLWAALLGAGPAWFTPARKLPYVLAMGLVSSGLSQVLLWSGHTYYAGYSLDDQRTGGGVMFVESSIVMLGAIVWLLLALLREPSATLRPPGCRMPRG